MSLSPPQNPDNTSSRLTMVCLLYPRSSSFLPSHRSKLFESSLNFLTVPSYLIFPSVFDSNDSFLFLTPCLIDGLTLLDLFWSYSGNTGTRLSNTKAIVRDDKRFPFKDNSKVTIEVDMNKREARWFLVSSKGQHQPYGVYINALPPTVQFAVSFPISF